MPKCKVRTKPAIRRDLLELCARGSGAIRFDPEFVGRLPVIATLEELDDDCAGAILTEPRTALTKQYAKLFDMEGVEIDFREDGLRA